MAGRGTRDDYGHFLDLSAVLTGFARVRLEGTGVGDQYFAKAHQEAGEGAVADLLAAWRTAEREGGDAVRRLILADAQLGPLARRVIKMWYLGVWDFGPYQQVPVSAEAYVQSLAWEAVGAHTQGAKQEGFGAWALPPERRA